MPAIVPTPIRSTFFLHQPVVLVLLLGLSTPVCSLVFATLLLFVALFLRLVDCLWVMLSRAVYRDELEWLALVGIIELMLSPSWNNDHVRLVNNLALVSNDIYDGLC